MTASGSGVPGRGSTGDDTLRRGIGRDIAAILLVGLIARLILAYLLPGSGFANDLASFQGWANDLATHGLWGFYDRPGFHDYTPGYLYALWAVGVVGNLLGGIGDLIKIPAILADLAIGWLVFDMALELGTSRRSARIAAVVVVFSPIFWFDSVVWGQVDSFGVVFLLLALRELWRDRTERSAFLAVLAALIKPQLGILAFLVAAVTIRRALWPAGGFGDEPAPTAVKTRLERSVVGPLRIVTTGAVGFLTAIVLSAPFGLSLPGLIDQLFKTAAGYPYVTVNAYNLWALVGAGAPSMAGDGRWTLDAPPVPPQTGDFVSFFGIPAVVVGAVLLGAVILGVSLLVARRPDRRTMLVGLAVLALAFFAVPTRVHERYLFPLFALGAILVAFSWRWRIAYTLASVAAFANMYVVLTTIYPDNPSISDWLGIGPGIRSAFGVTLVALTITAVFAWSLAQLRGRAARRLGAELEGDRAAAWREPEPMAAAAPAAPRPASAAARTDAAPGALVPAWFDRPALGGMSPVAWLRAKIAETPWRPDRSMTLRGEKGGRLDRLDLWMVIVLVLAAMCLRTYRLAEPARMHFDEVYHARTATEFLQDWRYGISHNIYEWTHPHLAKYVIAGGIVVFAGHDVAASSDLGAPVKDAVIEPRYDGATPGERDGDRVWVVTGSRLIALDLQTRKEEATWDIAGASTVAYDSTTHVVTVGTDAGRLETVDATSLDQVRAGAAGAAPSPVTDLGRLASGPVQLVAWDAGTRLAARFADGTVAIVDAGTGQPTGTAHLDGAADMADMGNGDALVATLAQVQDPAAEAKTLAGITGGDAKAYEAALQTAAGGAASVVLDATLTSDLRTKVQTAVDAGSLAGIAITPSPLLAVADSAGVDMLADNGVVASRVAMPGGAFGIATANLSDRQLYVATQSADGKTPQLAWITVSGTDAQNGPSFKPAEDVLQMPGPVSRVLYDNSAQMVEVLGKTGADGQATVYVVEPHGNAVFADQKVGFSPTAIMMDHNEAYPTSSRGQILAFSPAGQVAALDIGHYDFSWRMPGVIFGALTLAAIYLLTRVLFRRRIIAGLAGLFVLLDGMMFVQSRIAMNDVYVGFFIVAAYALFAWLWVEPRPRKWFWALMPVIGVLLGLGLGSKWVAAYAIGALGILVLARSALGRVVLILGMIAITAVLGWMALEVPGSGALGNVIFPLIMIGLTLGAVAISVYRPIAWSDDEIRLAVAGPAVLGILIALTAIALGKTGASIGLGSLRLTPLPLGFVLVVAGGLAFVVFNVAGRAGFGPMAVASRGRPSFAADPAPEGWLRLGEGLGLSTLWWAFCLIGLPLIVYIALYIPWANVENHVILPAGFPGFPNGWPAGHTGQTLLDLTGQMYNYHEYLSSPHPASSPWWAWPLNLKPVWFYQDNNFAGGAGGAIYDAGTLAIWWMTIPAMAFAAYQAFKRRSLALALLLVGFLAQWISWSRIDRASFQYHYYTSLPFLVITLAYFVAEVWHGASRRTWLLARAAAAVGVLGPALLWLFRGPVCLIAQAQSGYEINGNTGASPACNVNPGNLVVTPSVAALLLILLVGGAILIWQLIGLSRPRSDGRPVTVRDAQGVLATGIGLVALLILTRLLPSDGALVSVSGLAPEPIAIVALALCGLIALQIVTARDARRFVIGLIAAVAVNFLVLYPDISALPLPNSILPWYQGVLPTYLYPFMFWSNTANRNGTTSFADPRFAVLVAFIVLASVAVAYAAWTWRQALADGRPADEGAAPPTPGGSHAAGEA